MDPEISGFENIIIRGLFLGQTRKQMLAKVDEIAEFTELGDYLSMPLRTYSTGMRVRLAMGVVTSIDPEILLLDEGIGAVDAEFLKKAQTRLQGLVERSGILVFASHSNEFLARLCKTAMWIDHGTIKMTGGIEEVVRAYEGEDAARHVREILEENAREDAHDDRRSRDCARALVTHRRPDELAKSLDAVTTPDPRARPPDRRRQRRRRRGCAIWLPASRSRPPTSARAETSAAQAVSRSACCTRWRWARTGCGWPTTTARPAGPDVLATLLDCAGRHALAEVSPMVCDLDDPERLAFPLRRGLVWRRRVSELRTDGAGQTCCRASRRCSTARCSARRRWKPLACRICGCSSAATRWRCTGGWCARACRSAPAWTRCTCTRRAPTSSSRSSAAGCTPSTPDDAAKRFFTYRNRGYLLSQPGIAQAAAAGVAAVRLVLPGDPPRPRGVSRSGFGCAGMGRRERFEKPDMTFTDAAAQSKTMSRALARPRRRLRQARAVAAPRLAGHQAALPALGARPVLDHHRHRHHGGRDGRAVLEAVPPASWPSTCPTSRSG